MSKASEIFEELNALDEHEKIEAKRCANGADKSVLETICSFSNEPELDGGVILLGVSETDDDAQPYTVTGVTNADKIQKDLSTQCAEVFNHPVRPRITTSTLEGKKVIIVEVPELDPKKKPLFFKKEGLPRGAWRRVGSTDQHCTEEDLSVFYNEADNFDLGIAEDTELDDLDENAVRIYRKLRAEADPEAEELNYDDLNMLRAIKAVKKNKNGEWRLTNTGLLVFGKQMALRREMPAVRVDYIRVNGTEWVPDPHNRFQSIDMRGPLLLMVNRAFNAVADDLPRGFLIPPGSLQAMRPLSIPEDALREAIVNALVHQSLRVHRPIQIIRYSNRIEITNAGFSLKPADTLGEPGSEMRNPNIGSIFHDTKLAEAKGTGISTMRRLMKEAGMMPPTFESDRMRNIFTARILLHHFMSEDDVKWLASSPLLVSLNDGQKTALIFLREVGALDNITYRQLSGASKRESRKDIQGLVNVELLDIHAQGRYSYYTPSVMLLKLYAEQAQSLQFGSDNNSLSSQSTTENLDNNTSGLDNNGHTIDNNDVRLDNNASSAIDIIAQLPDELKQRLSSLKKRASHDTLKILAVELCAIMPLDATELAKLLNRSTSHIKQNIVRPLLKDGKLKFTIPEMINHPNQKYTAK